MRCLNCLGLGGACWVPFGVRFSDFIGGLRFRGGAYVITLWGVAWILCGFAAFFVG